MPQASRQSSPALAIVLDERKAFMGGETISGRIIRKSQLDDQNVSVEIRIFGRSKSRIQVSTGMTSATHRGRFNFFSATSTSGQTVHQGPLHIPSDGSNPAQWPFAITLPQNPDLASLKQDKDYAAKKTLLAPETAASHALPPSFYNQHGQYGSFSQVFVEYHLEATLRGSASGTSKKKKACHATAVYPLTVRPPSTPTPMTDFALKNQAGGRRTVVSQRLVPGMEDAKLSLGQKTKKALEFSKVPAFAFALEVGVPTVLQMGNPGTVPFLVRVSPVWRQTSEVLQDVPQRIGVQRFMMKLQTTTSYTTASTPSPWDYKSSVTLWEYNRPSPARANGSRAKSREAQGDQRAGEDTVVLSTASESVPLDLGRALGIKVGAAGNEVAGSSENKGIYPTFTTCNIKHEHRLVWELVLTVAKETAMFEGQQPVALFGPSYDQEMRG